VNNTIGKKKKKHGKLEKSKAQKNLIGELMYHWHFQAIATYVLE